MKKYLELIRIKHWIKNILIFVPIVCAKKVTSSNLLLTILGFFAFSFVSSFIYIINDIRDIESDKLHPRKKERPLPSGKITINFAIIISLLMIIAALILNSIINKGVTNISILILLIYVIFNILYSFGMKNVEILDILLLASGFVLRVYYGASILDIKVSNWLFLTVMSASFFLGLGKRKNEIINNKNSRRVLEKYNKEFLDKFQYVCLGLTLVFYSLWAKEQESSYIIYTVPIIIAIFMRYSLIIEKQNEGDPTTILYSDKFLLITCVLYTIIIILLMTVI